jgi:hypothetical protein
MARNPVDARKAGSRKNLLQLDQERIQLCVRRQAELSHGRRGARIRQPREAQKRLKEKINKLLVRGNPRPWSELRDALNRLLRGWANYFSSGSTNDARQAINNHLLERPHRFLSKRHKHRPHGTGQFWAKEIFGPLGVINVQSLKTRRAANARS